MFDQRTIDRFSSKVEQTDRGCWLWVGSLSPKGYGQFNISNNKPRRAHRVAWMLAHGEIPAGMFVCHRCDVPSCVNPDHLFLGTAQDNTDDMMRKGRKADQGGEKHPFFGKARSTETKARIRASQSGENHAQATITRETADAIKRLLADGVPCKSIASMFSTSIHVVYNISKGRSWR